MLIFLNNMEGFMKITNTLTIQMLAALITIGLLPGCAHYTAQPLNRTIVNRNMSSSNDQLILLDYHVFNKEDCKKYLDRDIIAAGYQPIHIALTNNTNNYLHLALSNFNFPVATPEEMASHFHNSTAGRAAGYGVAAALLFLPLAIPAIVDGVKSSKANKRLDIDYSRKSLRDSVISPLSTINGLIFVPIDSFNGHVSLKLIDTNTNKQLTLSSNQPYIKYT